MDLLSAAQDKQKHIKTQPCRRLPVFSAILRERTGLALHLLAALCRRRWVLFSMLGEQDMQVNLPYTTQQYLIRWICRKVPCREPLLPVARLVRSVDGRWIMEYVVQGKPKPRRAEG